MQSPQARATLPTPTTRQLLLVGVLVVLLATGYTTSRNFATSMEITVTWDRSPGSSTVMVFDRTITDLALVHTLQDALNRAPQDPENGDCNLNSQNYFYDFRFSTLGMATHEYQAFDPSCWWGVTTLGLPDAYTFSSTALQWSNWLTLPVVSRAMIGHTTVLDYLHKRYGMPLP